MENLNQVKTSIVDTETPFSCEFDASSNFHARSITTSHGWKISLIAASTSSSGLTQLSMPITASKDEGLRGLLKQQG